MKALVLSILALSLSLGVFAQTPEALAAQYVRVENNRVGGSLSEDQLSKMTAIYLECHSGTYADDAAKRKAIGQANGKAQALLSPAQKQARNDYFAKLKAEREAKAAAK